MAPELYETMEAKRLVALARKIQEWQKAKQLSTEGLVKQVPQVGSSKTFTRILVEDLKELDLEKQLANYEAAVAWIESIGDEKAEEEELYDDLGPALALKRAFLETKKENGNARVIFVLGPSGSGKTSARRTLCTRYGSRLALVEANVAWNDSPGAMLGEILRCLGVRNVPTMGVERLHKVTELLNDTRRCLIIEEGHHLGPKCLNLVKTLVNETPGEFIIIAIDTLWAKLETKAYEEAKQLTGNRLADRVNLGKEMRPRDVRLLVERRTGLTDEKLRDLVTNAILHHAPKYGRFAFVRDVLSRVAEKAKDKHSPAALTQELFSAAIQEEVASR